MCFVCSQAQDVIVYFVNRDDYNFENVTRKVMPQQELGVNYKTLVLVYDQYRDEVIGGWGADYEDKYMTKPELKKIVDDAIQDLYHGRNIIRTKTSSANSNYDGILGLHWGMKIEAAINDLNRIGLIDWEKVADEEYQCFQDVSWNGTTYNAVRLGFYTTNRQNRYLTEVRFFKLCQTATEAKNVRESIAGFLKMQYGKSVREEIGENKFKQYYVIEDKGKYSTTRINLSITKVENIYGIILNYSGMEDVAELIVSES